MHVPVLLNEVLSTLKPSEGESYLDLTAGYGGHSTAVLEVTKAPSEMVLVDQDETAVNYLSEKYSDQNVLIKRTNFVKACQDLLEKEDRFDMILADIGVSSQHLDNASRGFSFMADGPLDMRMDQQLEVTAADIVNTASADELIRILKEYGEEPKAKRIVSELIKARPLTTTRELAVIVEAALGWRHKGHHPATRTFQGLRIAVNDELGRLEKMLPLAMQLLKPGGRFGVITFHSLEDRIVKHIFNEATSGGYDAEFLLLTKKALSTSSDETVLNPRARSAKLRAVAKIKTERTE